MAEVQSLFKLLGAIVFAIAALAALTLFPLVGDGSGKDHEPGSATMRTLSRHATAPAPTVQTAPVTQHREAARALVREHCGLCHTKHDASNGLPDVTHIFDVDEPDWSKDLSDDQLAAALDNLAEDGPEIGELTVFERFIADELAWRDAHPALYPAALRERPRRGTTQ